MKKICFLIPDGVGVRNYLYTDLFRLLKEQGYELIIWHSLANEVISLSAEINGFTPQQKNLMGFKEDLVVKLLRESSTYARLMHNVKLTSNPTIMANWHDNAGSIQRNLVHNLSRFLGKMIKGHDGILAVEKLYFKRLRRTTAYKYYREELRDMNPDLLFCTHQRYPGAAFAMAAAEDLNIKTCSAIFSWDNLPKARLPLRSDSYIVWSSHMKKELRFYYPEIEESQIKITGTPQFDFYEKKDIIQPREDFAREFGLDPSKKWICFSGSDSKTSPYDAAYLRDVANALKDESDIQLILRQAPVESSERYVAVLQEFPLIRHLSPIWHKGDHWNQFYPYPQDISHLVNLSYHCASVVNIGSTMALDFSWFDSPALYLNYDHAPGQAWTTKDIYKFQHFRSMEDWDSVVWVDSPEEIIQKVKLIIDDPTAVAKDRKKWLNKIVEPQSDLTATSRIATVFNQLIGYPTQIN